MDRAQLAEQIANSPLSINGQEDPNPDTNPLLAAYSNYPRIRRLIDASPHNNYDDVLCHRITADITEQAIRLLKSR